MIQESTSLRYEPASVPQLTVSSAEGLELANFVLVVVAMQPGTLFASFSYDLP